MVISMGLCLSGDREINMTMFYVLLQCESDQQFYWHFLGSVSCTP